MRNLRDIIPSAEAVLELEPEELGLVVLRVLNARKEPLHHWANFANEFEPRRGSGYPDNQSEFIQMAVVEAWSWLQAQVLIAPSNKSANGWFFVTRRGRRIIDEGTATEYLSASAMPWQLIHPRIAEVSRASFLRGDYETAVFKAFKEIEVEVREAGGFTDADIGINLMRKAFAPGGPLADAILPKAEQEGLANLAAGAIGSYKNSHSHRTVTLKDPIEAAEMIFLASHLLNIVYARRYR